ncbi:hypothetical protein NLU13_7127 [Sarocladium strictum]|uniref:Phospholipase/carboxylesterase/thioesterase domain-containing protein n=1 Tax=Sarocladium strictum TaxID=5046 RepID=A0AA39L6J0_SARSR|nr:hypothetical protein NLU13_7127 [Sarocladium strictum]
MRASVHLDPIPSNSHTHTVIFLHGRGGSASALSESFFDSLDSRGRNLRDLFPSFRWVFPKAPLCRPWFDVADAKDLSVNEELQVGGLHASVEALKSIIAEEAEKLHGKYVRLILAGISQGASAAIHTLLHLDKSHFAGFDPPRLGAFVGFCSRLPLPGQTLKQTRSMRDSGSGPDRSSVLSNTPILLEHSIDDPLAKVEDGRILRDALYDRGAHVEWIEYPAGGHWIQSPQGIEDAADFLRRALELTPDDTDLR